MATEEEKQADRTEREKKMEQFLIEMDELDDEVLKQITEIAERAKTSHEINKNELDTEIIKTISDMHRYNTMLAENRANLSKLSRKKEVIHGELYEKYSRNYQVKLDTKYEIEEYINRNPKWQKITAYYNNQKILVDYLQDIVKVMHTKTYGIKYIIENKKIELS
jgi:hypothetical protein